MDDKIKQYLLDKGIKVYPFPVALDMESLNYCVFPKAIEDDEKIFFHATAYENLEDIIENGFKCARTLNVSSGLESISFACKSSTALFHVTVNDLYTKTQCCIIAVRYPIALSEMKKIQGIRVNLSDIHDFDENRKRDIIGVSLIPMDYNKYL